MNNRVRFNVWTLIAFLLAVSIHLLVVYLKTPINSSMWVQVLNPSHDTWFDAYLKSQDYYLSFSYGLAAGFAAYGISLWTSNRRLATVGGTAGLSLAGVIWGAACFLAGCCGSPMLGVYVSLLGSRAAGFGKPLTAIITLFSVVLGYWLIQRKTCPGDCSCHEVNPLD